MPSDELTIGIYDRDDPLDLLVELGNFQAPTVRKLLRDVGQGQFALNNGDEDLALIPIARCLAKFRINGLPRAAVLVERMRRQSIAAGEESAESTVISGRTSLALLDESVLWPERGVEATPYGDARRYDYTSRDLDTDDWSSASVVKVQGTAGAPYDTAPASWPDPTAKWIWADSASTPEPVGVSYFRQFFSVLVETPIRIFITADDGFELCVDGVTIGGETQAYLWREVRVFNLDLSIDEHLLAVKVTNIDRPSNPSTNIAGLIVAVYEVLDGGDTLGDLLFHSDETWLARAYPATPPGFTVGRMLRLMVEEAQAHALLQGVTCNFGDLDDSEGVNWPAAPEWSFEVGTSLLQVVKRLVDAGYCDVEMDPETHILWAWVRRGGSTAVELLGGGGAVDDDDVNLIELVHEITS